MSARVITVVSGLPRSGTSLMMQMLVAGGLPALTDGVRAPDENNPRGYFEFEGVKRLRADASWLEEAEGRAVKIIHILLRELPSNGPFQYRILFMRRPLEEVIASQQAMLSRAGKTSGDPLVLVKAYRNQIAQLEQWLRDQTCFQLLSLEYHRVLQDPLTVAQEIKTFLGMELDVVAMAAAVNRDLYRQRSDSASKRVRSPSGIGPTKN
jgi:hypothetical protein